MSFYCSDCDYTLHSEQDNVCPFCGTDISMDEGDYHSGPDGYEPSTAYPNTYYGGLDDYEDEEYNR